MGTKTINAHQNILSDRDDIRITPQGAPEQLLAAILLRRLVIYGQKAAVRGGGEELLAVTFGYIAARTMAAEGEAAS